ncbi:MAG: DUF3592 domain-containing protein [Clostridia bacterium]|nr:DUF3592 domain-containing protein [Clostridia bacterium]
MLYDKNREGHYFRITDEPVSGEQYEMPPEQNGKVKQFFLKYSIIILIIGGIICSTVNKLVTPGTSKAQVLIIIETLVFLTYVLKVFNSENSHARAIKNQKIIANVVLVITVVVTLVGLLYMLDVIEFNIDTNLALYVVGGLLLFTAIVLLVNGLKTLISTKRRYTCRDEATCIGFDDRLGRVGTMVQVMSCPVYELRVNGQLVHIYDGNYKPVGKLPTIGSKVKVIYDEDNPQDAVIGDRVNNGATSICFAMIMGVICLGIILPLIADNKVQENKSSKELTVQDYYKKVNRFSIDDEFIEDVLEIDGEDHDFDIYLRTLEDTEDDMLVFEELDGLDTETVNVFTSVEVGDEYYWIERDDGLVLVLKKGSYMYTGSNLK